MTWSELLVDRQAGGAPKREYNIARASDCAVDGYDPNSCLNNRGYAWWQGRQDGVA